MPAIIQLKMIQYYFPALVYRRSLTQLSCTTGLFGYSAGGNVAVLHAAKHPGSIPFVVNASGRFLRVCAAYQVYEERRIE